MLYLLGSFLSHHSVTKCLTSFAKFLPNSVISCSVLSSFDVEDKNKASGYKMFRVFLKSLISNEFPWNPCTKTKTWFPGLFNIYS